MKTFNDLPATTTLENAAILPANNADNTTTNKITFQNLKSQIQGSLVTDISISGATISASHADGSAATTVTLPTASNEAAGITKIYSSTGNNTDGTMTQSAISSAITSAYTGADGVTIGNDQVVKADLKSAVKSSLTAAAMGNTADRQYAVGLDVNGNLSVNVPWANDNTTYTATDGVTLDGTAFKADIKSATKSALTATDMGSTSGKQYAVGLDANGDLSVNIPWTDTHYASSTIVAGSGTAKADAAANNGAVVINHVENDSVVSSHGITGAGGTSVTSDANGNITITSTDNDTWIAMVGATDSANGTAGYVPAPPSTGYNTKYLRADGTWAVVEQITVDSALSDSSSNPVQNQVVKGALDLKANAADLGTAAAKDISDTYDSTSDDAISGIGVAAALATLPEPMVFKGSLGTGGTITSLPAASSSGSSKNTGFTYKVIEDGTYQSIAAKAGDTFISTGSAWVLIPSGDEPSGTVTSVGITEGTGIDVSGGPVTSSGSITVSHEDTSDQASVSNSGRTYIQSITLDGMGHVTAITSATETVVDTDTHYASSTVVANANNATSDAASTNGNTYINHVENGSVVSAHNIVGSGATSVTSDSSGVITISSTDNDTWVALVGATSEANGTAGYAPAPPSDGYNTKYLRADGTWAIPPDNNTWTALVGATDSADGTAGYAPAPPSTGYNTKYLRADGTWAVPPDNNTWTAMVGATNAADGTAGYAPAPPSTGYNTKFLRADGTWAEPLPSGIDGGSEDT